MQKKKSATEYNETDFTLNFSMAAGRIIRNLPLICNGISVNDCEGTSRHNDILGVVKHAVTALAVDNPGLDSLMSCHLELKVL